MALSIPRLGRRRADPATVDRVVADLRLPDAIFKTCPWQPRDLVETGLRQWLRCCGAAMRDDQVIGMPSHAVDEAWHGLILCTRLYARFCDEAYGRFLHHFPEGVGEAAPEHGSMIDQLGRTVVAWSMVAKPDEQCVLWDLDRRVGVAEPWGVDARLVDAVQRRLEPGVSGP
ncbi:hypothetical protein ACFC06_24430 [Nocardia sp. NPDC056064]|uniref:hypothetical protein n=1 Tax=Nocardia sp. NPDC056064 TaxID=3345701 RepID=UPI0035DB5A88